MQTPASVAGHPLHPMLVVFPVGLWVFSLLCDLLYLGGGSPEVWSGVALYTMVGGFLGALVAAIPGVVDFLALRGGQVRRLAVAHMSLNVLLVVLYAVNIWLRVSNPSEAGLPIVMSIASVLLLAVSGWLGAEMVHVHGVGVKAVPAGEGSAAETGTSYDRRHA